MALRVWLHEGHDGEPGVVALGLDFLGFSTWAESEAEVLPKIPAKFGEYCAWRSRHGVPVSLADVPGPPAEPDGEWEAFLPQSRAQVLAFLEDVKSSPDLVRAQTIDHGFGEEAWSIRKALRRLVAHELLHSKSIARIIRDYLALHPGA